MAFSQHNRLKNRSIGVLVTLYIQNVHVKFTIIMCLAHLVQDGVLGACDSIRNAGEKTTKDTVESTVLAVMGTSENIQLLK